MEKTLKVLCIVGIVFAAIGLITSSINLLVFPDRTFSEYFSVFTMIAIIVVNSITLRRLV